jgi:hypothetical protein
MGDFGGQWIEIFSAGKHTDNRGREHQMNADFLERVVTNFNPAVHEPPAVVGHPKTNAPAYGWAKELRVRDGKLEARLGEVDPAFEGMVKDGRFKKRSASFYIDAEDAPGGKSPQLRHVGFLGAEPPAVKGLRGIDFSDFSDGDKAVTFDEGGEEMDEDKVVEKVTDRMKDFFKGLLGGGDKGAPASFSEADVRKMVGSAVTEATASFNEKLKTVEDENKKLASQVSSIGKDTTKARILNFAERMGAAKFPPAFRRATSEGGVGLVEFMERIAETDSKVTVVSFSEGSDGKKVEKKAEVGLLEFFERFIEHELPGFIEFGEAFGTIRDDGTGTVEMSEERLAAMRATAGIKAEPKK